MTGIVEPVVIATLVVIEVAVWQVRVAMASRGRKRSAAALGAVNAVISVVALAQVVTHLDRPENVAGYAVGVAAGVYLGVVVDGRIARSPVEFRVVLPGDGGAVAEALRSRGRSVTTQSATGPNGQATVLHVVVAGTAAAELDRDLAELAPDGFRTSSTLRTWALPAPLAQLAPQIQGLRELATRS